MIRDKWDVIIGVFAFIIFVWDVITWPIYQAVLRPWEVRKAARKTRSAVIRSTENEIVYEAPEKQNDLHDELTRAKCSTMAEVWTWIVSMYGNRDLLGTRDILAEEDEVQPNGKIFKKLSLGDYRWVSYKGVDQTADFFGKGLRSLGLQPSEKICIFADTRSEWFISAQAAFKQNFPLVTLYTNLGEEAVEHGLNQTKATLVLTTHDLLPKFKNILKNTPTVKTIVYFEDQVKRTDTSGYRDDVNIVPFWEVTIAGKRLATDPRVAPIPPASSSTAIIMYTSGSTGVPKGVVLSHKNLFYTLKSFTMSIEMKPQSGDTYIAFLPLAHVLELLCETMMSLYGIRIGYSTPNTLLDKSSMIKRGSKGDASILRPNFMAAVPLILDRVYKTITETVRKKGSGFEKFFKYCYNYRLAAVKRGEKTPILDLLIFRNLRAPFGGRIRLMVSGGAPLSKETHEFIMNCLGCPILQGYGLTETCANSNIMEVDEISTETVGPPNQLMQVKLINWEEGNYRVTDKPCPRGEVIIGGNSIAEGYFGMPEKTAEDFYEAQGRKWFRTGDIGEMQPDGTLKIIDRKKDLVKLQFGEYVSLGKVEACLKTCPIVENVCIYGHSSKSYVVALVCPERGALKKLAEKFGKQDLEFEQMCEDRDLTGAALREIINHGKTHKLEKFEIPAAVTLCKETWTPESGLVTAAFKIKRKPIQDFYKNDLSRMYGESSKHG